MAWLSCWIAMTVLVCIAGASATQADSEEDGNRPRPQAWEYPWTVVTMAPDGSWGAGTEAYIYQAIAKAVSNCKKMSRQQVGCGAQFRAIRSGWIIALRCGKINIIAAEPSIAAAESAAADHERGLRLAYGEEMPSCVRVVAVDPSGSVIDRFPDAGWPDITASGSSAR